MLNFNTMVTYQQITQQISELTQETIPYMQIGQSCNQCHKGKMELAYAAKEADERIEPYPCLLCSECNAEAYIYGRRYVQQGDLCYECGDIFHLTQDDDNSFNGGKPYLHCWSCAAFAFLEKPQVPYRSKGSICSQCHQGRMRLINRVNKLTGKMYHYVECDIRCGAKAYPFGQEGFTCPKCQSGTLEKAHGSDPYYTYLRCSKHYIYSDGQCDFSED